MEYKTFSKALVDMNRYRQCMSIPRHEEIKYRELLSLHRMYMKDFEEVYGLSRKVRHKLFCASRNGLEILIS